MNAKLIKIAESILSEHYQTFYRDNGRILNMIENYDAEMMVDLFKSLQEFMGDEDRFNDVYKHLGNAAKAYAKAMKINS